jgi:hypothetical protein
MNNQAGIPLFNVPPIDPRTGQWNRPWLLFLQTLWERTGGAQGVSSDDLNASLFDDSGVEELKAQFFGLGNALLALPPTIPTATSDDQTPPTSPTILPDDLSRPDLQQTPPDVPSGRLEALEALVQRLQSDIEAIRQGQQL